jgi:hypothetical protein
MRLRDVVDRFGLRPSADAPADPMPGELWADDTTGRLKRWVAGTWQTLAQTGDLAVPVLTYDGPFLGPSANFTNTAQASWTTADWSFTPSRDGWATISADLDTQDVTAGYGLATTYIRAAGVQIDGITIRFEGQRLSTRFTARKPIRVTANTALALGLDVNQLFGSGSWKINSLVWRVTVT